MSEQTSEATDTLSELVVGKVVDHDKVYNIASGMEKMGPVLQKLYDTLRGIQLGTIEGPAGWVHEVK